MGTPEIIGGGVLGEKVQGARRQLDVFELARGVTDVRYISDEVSSLCPITGQPDWYEIEIWISQTRFGLESKSVKLYLQSFREDGQFCEQFADTIAEDVLEAIDIEVPGPIPYPIVEVRVQQKPRGGVSIVAHALREKSGRF